MHANELRLFFTLSSDLHKAIRDQHDEARTDALMELVSIWLHGTNARIRARCAALLEAHGMREEMDEICATWAR